MIAFPLAPGQQGSARLEDVDEPPRSDGPILAETLAVGVCGTDMQMVAGRKGVAPPGRERIVLGHEVVGRVLEGPHDGALAAGDLMVGIVRRPDPVPCGNCAAGEWDMCRNGRYTERGIKGRDGFASERWRLSLEFAVRIDCGLAPAGILVEPASIVAKGWEQIDRIGGRSYWEPHRTLVIGAGTIGLLAALLGVQRGLEVHVLDVADRGPKPALVRDLGATYHAGPVAVAAKGADIVLECSGADMLQDILPHLGRNAIVCLLGTAPGVEGGLPTGQAISKRMVLENTVVFGSVNANRRHYQTGMEALSWADLDWLQRLITRRVPLREWRRALVRDCHDVKTVLDFTI